MRSGLLLTRLIAIRPSTSSYNAGLMTISSNTTTEITGPYYEATSLNTDLLDHAVKEFKSFQKTVNFNRIAEKVIPVKATPNHLQCELVLGREHLNSKGTLHGGMTAAIVDIVTARAVGLTNRNQGMASIEISVSYLAPIQLGDTVLIQATVLKHGRNIAFTECEFRRKSDDKLCVKARHTIALISGQPSVFAENTELC
ncbi:unnamed protein product, partial [Mesorhabditis spiculigera]